MPNFTHSPYGGATRAAGPTATPHPMPPGSPVGPPHSASAAYPSVPLPQPSYHAVPPMYHAPPPPPPPPHDIPPSTSPYNHSPVPVPAMPGAPNVQSYAPIGFSQQLQHYGGAPIGLPVMAPMAFDGPPLSGPVSGGGGRRRSRRGDSGNQRLDLSNSGGRSGEFGSGKLHHSSDGGVRLQSSNNNRSPGNSGQFRGSRRGNHHNSNASSSRHHVHQQSSAPPPPPVSAAHHASVMQMLQHSQHDFSDHGSYATSEREERDSLVSGSSSSSVRDDLPLCENDSGCSLINDRRHQRQWSHTCRLFPCYHASVKRHAKLFRHVPGQLVTTPQAPVSNGSQSNLLGTKGKHSQRATMALASVNFMHISQDAPNATKITVTTTSKSYEIAGDWTQVKLHTLKRYLHQVFGVAPGAQQLVLDGVDLDDDLALVSACGVVEGSQITLKFDEHDRALDL